MAGLIVLEYGWPIDMLDDPKKGFGYRWAFWTDNQSVALVLTFSFLKGTVRVYIRVCIWFSDSSGVSQNPTLAPASHAPPLPSD